jgi:hypothetical protein
MYNVTLLNLHLQSVYDLRDLQHELTELVLEVKLSEINRDITSQSICNQQLYESFKSPLSRSFFLVTPKSKYDPNTMDNITDNKNSSPRLFMKMHFMACDDNCSDFYLWYVKQYHIYYYTSMRNLQNETGGRNPSTFKEFFFGLMSHYYYNSYTKYFILFFLIGIILISYKFIKHLKKRIFFIIISFIILYLLIVSFYWLRYILFGIR